MTNTNNTLATCEFVQWDGGEYVQCRRSDVRVLNATMALCPEHASVIFPLTHGQA